MASKPPKPPRRPVPVDEIRAALPAATAEYARVALDLPLDREYQYLIPEPMREALRLGSLVRVPVKSRECMGCVVRFEAEPAAESVKPILAHVSAPFTIGAELIELSRWIADYYMAPFGEALRTVSFIGFSDMNAPVERLICLADPAYWLLHPGDDAPDGSRVTPFQRRVIEALIARANEPTPKPILRADADVSDSIMQAMLKRGLIENVSVPVAVEDEYGVAPPALDEPRQLNAAQRKALEPILEALREKEYRSFLLHGVTGSGKTEVYLQAIAEALRQGRQAIVLTPEIALTPQLVDRFRARFGEIVGVYHHRQTLRQKFDLWRRIQQGEIKIVIGARSALFAPFPALGVIVVDEEHTSSYKQNVSPRYHARDVALVRGRARRAAVILGSATPSLESYYNARAGKHTLLDLPERASGVCAMPSIELIDMARELRKTHASPGVLSARLKEAIDRRLERREQSLLLLNRRGYASISVCLECEAVENCPDCSASMTYHKTQDCLVCHLCGMRRRRAEACPACGSREMELVGLGTQKVEEAIRDLFPQARIIRLDSDSARGRTAWIDAWRAIEKREYDLILGTQMVAKGLHLEGLTLVGIVSADTTLFQPDFRAGERTFSLLSQAAGRAGRGDEPGEVIIQSYSPGHYAIQLACRHDYAGLYEQEMRMRRPLRFPPVERLISILVSAEQPETAMGMAKRLDSLLRNLARQERFAGLSVLGPAPCPIERVRGRWRWRLLARGERPAAMHAMARAALEEFDQLASRRKVEVTVDVDPQDLL